MKKIGIIFLICVFLIGMILIYLNINIVNLSNFNKEPETKAEEKHLEPEIVVLNESEPEIIYEENTSLSLVMVGDYLIHNSVYKDAARNARNNGYDFKPMLELIKDKVKDYDLKYYNQETILGGSEIGVSDYPNFNSPYEAGDGMIDSGFNLVSLATNHTMDRGAKAVLNSRDYWNNQENVLAVGSYNSEENRDEIIIKEANGITYTMLNYTYGTNGMPVPDGKEYLVNVWPTNLSIHDPEKDLVYQEYKEKVKQEIEKVRDKVDLLIVAMHWGEEYTHIPTIYQEDEAEFLASLGVDIIIGTHPHVVQPVKWIGNTLVFYSLGNFISAQKQNDNYNKYYDRAWSNFKVIPFSDSAIAEKLPNYEKVYEKYRDIVQNFDKEMKVEKCFGRGEIDESDN